MKRFLSLLISISIIMISLSMFLYVYANDDAAKEHREAMVQMMIDEDVVRGDEKGDIKPYDKVTRAEMAAMIIRKLGKEDKALSYSDSATGFVDDSDIAEWERAYIAYGEDIDMVDGYPDGTVRSSNNVTYEEGVKFVVCAFDSAAERSYPDGYIERAQELGYLTGVEGILGVELTREQIITLIANAGISNSGTGDKTIANIDEFTKEQMSIERVVQSGIMDLDENNNFNFQKEMTVGEVNDAVARMARYVADETDNPSIVENIPQIDAKSADETATIEDVVSILTDPGIETGAPAGWVEMARPSILREVAFLLTPSGDVETALAALQTTQPAFQGYTAAMIFKAMHMWSLLENWSDGYYATFDGKSTANDFVAYDGSNYYYLIHGTGNTGIYCENSGTYYKLVNHKRSYAGINMQKLIGAYNGYVFYLDGGDVYRVDKDGKYPRRLTYDIGGTDWMIDGDYIYYTEPVYNYYRVPITSVDFEADAVAVESRPFSNTDGDDKFIGDNLNLGLGATYDSANVMKNDTTLISHGRALLMGEIDLYNEGVYYLLRNQEDGVSDPNVELWVVSRNGDVDFSRSICDMTTQIPTDKYNNFSLGMAGDYAFIHASDTLKDDVYYKVCVDEDSEEYGIPVQLTIPDDYVDLVSEISDTDEPIIVSQLQYILDNYNFEYNGGQSVTDSFTVTFNNDNEALVRAYAGISDDIQSYIYTTYEVIDAQTIELKWDVHNFRNYLQDGNWTHIDVSPDMPVTTFICTTDEITGDYILESTESVSGDDPSGADGYRARLDAVYRG